MIDMNRMDRLFAIVLQLQARGQCRAQDLAAEFEVSPRTIYRDVDALCEAGVPIVATPGRGYSLSEGHFLPPLMFTAMEAGALALGADHVARVLDEPFRAAAESAQAKLSNALTGDTRRELRELQDSMRFIQAEIEPAHPFLRELRDAILSRQVLEITYHAYGRPAPEPRRVEPYGLIHYNRSWHLLAYCRERQAPTNFRLDRIDSVRMTGSRFERVLRMGVRQLPHEAPAATIEAHVLVDAAAMRWIREQPPFGLVEERARGDQYMLTFRVRDLERLGRALMQWGDAIEVLDPSAMREQMSGYGRRMVERQSTGRHAPDGPLQ